MAQDPALPTPEDEVANTVPSTPAETPTPSPVGDGKESTPTESAKPRRGKPKQEPPQPETPPETSPEVAQSETPEDATPNSAQGDTLADTPTALSAIAQQILTEHELDIVFMTTDGTAFFGYSDAINYARNLTDESVSYFTRTGLSADALQRLLPTHLQPPTTSTNE